MMSDDNFFNPSKLAILSIKFFRESITQNNNIGAPPQLSIHRAAFMINLNEDWRLGSD